MDNKRLTAAATQEIEQPTFGVVSQFLEIHEIAYQDGKPVVAGITTDEVESQAVVYFTVKGEAFYFAVQLTTEPRVQVVWADTAAFARVSFEAYSETHSLPQLLGFTRLFPTETDETPEGISFLTFEPNPEPGTPEGKIKKLLTLLEQDATGVKKLAENANGAIRAYVVFHNGNTMLGGIVLGKSEIQRLATLNLEINFDLYAAGNKFT
ncbi:DUF4279 domain-containing protein [Hymenobacter sp. M29]|uniref:DUF4279 domain-containing protein n=1 Tax=Hymenobacter mellowenesis TaxID=3063995 RepID=A0ABT9A749_9BACT|nr:DUF4279 domain-containing protein [Hymenobacter sp. M29]MDO7845668.1 DUF4279 domain-containing protein [Hymenobacter sp. M29]